MREEIGKFRVSAKTGNHQSIQEILHNGFCNLTDNVKTVPDIQEHSKYFIF